MHLRFINFMYVYFASYSFKLSAKTKTNFRKFMITSIQFDPIEETVGSVLLLVSKWYHYSLQYMKYCVRAYSHLQWKHWSGCCESLHNPCVCMYMSQHALVWIWKVGKSCVCMFYILEKTILYG